MSKEGSGEKLIATNPSARSNYHLEEVVEAGIVLLGTEIKSIRSQSPSLKDAFVEVSRNFEAWLVNSHIAPYSHGNRWNHEPTRRRKLLLHKGQIERIHGALTREGRTVVPTRMYFTKGNVKVEIAIAKGKKKGDKREDVKKKAQDREIEKAMKRSR